MASLHTVTELTKSIAKYGAILLCGILLFLFGINMGKVIKTVFFPAPPVKLTTTFGKLPAIQFPKNVTNKKLTYIVDTLSGFLPTFGSTVFINKMTINEQSLVDLKNAQNHARSVGFTTPETKLQDSIYQWINYDPLPETLTANVVTFNFTLNAPFLLYPPIVTGSIFDTEKARAQADTFLSNMDGIRSDMDSSLTKSYTYDIDNGNIIEATSPARVRIVEVNYFQKNIVGLPVLYPIPKKSTMRVTVAVDRTTPSGFQIVDAHYFHQNIGSVQATYPLKSIQKAFQELQNGKGYIAAYYGNKDTVKIKDAFLAYYLEDTDQAYLMPIYVFKGLNDEFYAYVSAVDNAWIQ